MSIELNERLVDVWRVVRWLGFSVLAVAALGCHADAESESPPPSRWWYVEDAPPSDAMPYRTAMLSALEGWNDRVPSRGVTVGHRDALGRRCLVSAPRLAR